MRYTTRVSFLERIYAFLNTGLALTIPFSINIWVHIEFRDLLHPDITSKEIIIREDREGKIFFTGAREVSVTCYDEAMQSLERGCLNRTSGN